MTLIKLLAALIFAILCMCSTVFSQTLNNVYLLINIPKSENLSKDRKIQLENKFNALRQEFLTGKLTVFIDTYNNYLMANLKGNEVLYYQILAQSVKFRYVAKGNKVYKRESQISLISKGSQDTFYTINELNEFFKDTLVVTDTLFMDLSKIEGIDGYKLNYGIADSGNDAIVTTALNKQIYLNRSSEGVKSGQYQQLNLTFYDKKEFQFNTTIYFLSEMDKEGLDEYILYLKQPENNLSNPQIVKDAAMYLEDEYGGFIWPEIGKYVQRTKLKEK